MAEVGNGKHSLEAAAAVGSSPRKGKNGNGHTHSGRDAVKVKGRKGLQVNRRFTQPNVHPFDEIEWDQRGAAITDENGKVIFEQKDVEIPKAWSQLATNVVVSKYFRGQVGTIFRERSARQLVGRVADTLAKWGLEGDYFASAEDAETFRAELAHILLHQKCAFNSPVWFNLGVEPKPQCSACFIQSVKDEMSSIMDLAKSEVMLFKYGSGTGSNLSTLRSSKENLSGGGIASGPLSFMKGYDAFAGAIKSGGKTRRAAKMVILDVDHPDVVPFITCKADEERKAWALIDSGYEAGFNVPGGAYDSIAFQNANHSVRVSDDFMQAVLEDRDWWTRYVTTGQPADKHRARDLLRKIAEATWICGDPGMQFDTTINDWHTCAGTDRIYASNPCSEYMFLNDSACNLASFNLMKFRRADGDSPLAGSFDVEAFEHAVDILITAMEIIVDNADYPTPAIAKNSHDFRPLGLGYANLGALLMAQGVPYDSEKGRAICGAITALLTGRSYRQSAELARVKGAFPGSEKNRQPMLRVIRKHRAAVDNVKHDPVAPDLMQAAHDAWDQALALGEEHGYRNSQATVIAPTGTIAFMMDCDTTGIEPDIALIKYKKLVGGGLMKIVNQTVPEALRRLGYSPEQVEDIVRFTDENGSIEGAPHLKDEHLQVFDCAFRAPTGTRAIHYMGHLRMMAAAQPFISGAISKTVNVPEDITVDELAETYIQAWKLGLKAVAVYRDGCKRSQPLSTSLDKKAEATQPSSPSATRPTRRRLPDERQAITHKINIAGHEGYLTVGLYEDGQPGELFITMSKQGSTISGLMDSFATSVSIALQYGVPLRVLVQKFIHSRFEPSGFTGNSEIPVAKSIMDYVFRWLALKFLTSDEAATAESEAEEEAKPLNGTGRAPSSKSVTGHFVASGTRNADIWALQTDAPPCHLCGAIMIRAGACYACTSCGETSGCG